MQLTCRHIIGNIQNLLSALIIYLFHKKYTCIYRLMYYRCVQFENIYYSKHWNHGLGFIFYQHNRLRIQTINQLRSNLLNMYMI